VLSQDLLGEFPRRSEELKERRFAAGDKVPPLRVTRLDRGEKMNSQITGESSGSITNGFTRRGALCALATLSLGVIARPAEAAVGVKVLKSGAIEVLLARNPALSKVGGVVQIDNVNGRSIALVRSGKGKKAYTALDLRCTHEGERVKQEGDLWSCPRHGATFGLAGDLKIGPANTPLRKLAVKVQAKKITIS
jgi:Rieske Fe-S protein